MAVPRYTITPWRTGLLIGLWIWQMIAVVGLLGLTIFAAIWLSQYSNSEDGRYPDAGSLDRRGLSPVDILLLVTCSLCIIFIIAEIILLRRRNLSPKLYLLSNAIKTTLWTVILVLQIVATAFDNGRRYGAATISISLVILILTFLFFLAALVYGSLVFHRQRKGRLGQMCDAEDGIESHLSSSLDNGPGILANPSSVRQKP